MPKATRIGDQSSGHDSCPPEPLAEGSPNVFINGKGAGRSGDKYSPHGCIVHSSHQDSIVSGSSSVYINGKKAGRLGDSIQLAGSVAEGSPNVFIGG